MLRSVTTACLPHHTLPQNVGGPAQRWPNKASWPPEKLGGRLGPGSHKPSQSEPVEPAGVRTGSRGLDGGGFLAICRGAEASHAAYGGSRGSPRGQDSWHAGSLLPQGQGLAGHPDLGAGLGSERGLRFWEKSSTWRPQRRGQVRDAGTNRKAVPKHGPSCPSPALTATCWPLPHDASKSGLPHLADLLCPHDLGSPGSAGRQEKETTHPHWL